jgi:hypothetical protein
MPWVAGGGADVAGQILGWTIDTWSAFGSVLGGVGGSAAFIALAVEARGRSRSRRLAPPELLPLLISLRSDLQEVVALGGAPPRWFMEPERQRRETELAAWHLMINDDKLRHHVGDARSAQHEAFTYADTLPLSAQDQIDAARNGVSAIDRALTRVGWLTRMYG